MLKFKTCALGVDLEDEPYTDDLVCSYEFIDTLEDMDFVHPFIEDHFIEGDIHPFIKKYFRKGDWGGINEHVLQFHSLTNGIMNNDKVELIYPEAYLPEILQVKLGQFMAEHRHDKDIYVSSHSSLILYGISSVVRGSLRNDDLIVEYHTKDGVKTVQINPQGYFTVYPDGFMNTFEKVLDGAL